MPRRARSTLLPLLQVALGETFPRGWIAQAKQVYELVMRMSRADHVVAHDTETDAPRSQAGCTAIMQIFNDLTDPPINLADLDDVSDSAAINRFVADIVAGRIPIGSASSTN